MLREKLAGAGGKNIEDDVIPTEEVGTSVKSRL